MWNGQVAIVSRLIVQRPEAEVNRIIPVFSLLARRDVMVLVSAYMWFQIHVMKVYQNPSLNSCERKDES
jgi:hypothetical protein